MTTVDNQTTGAAAPAGATTSTQAAQAERPKYNFPVSEVPKNPLGEGRYIKTAAALVIGYVYPCETVLVHEEVDKYYTCRDEILNGKTLDRNSNYFARYCFEQGVELWVLSLQLWVWHEQSCDC